MSPKTICSHTYDEFLTLIQSFHGHVAPGVLIGGFMVDLAYRHLPKEGLFDAISETRACLPDAIQLLTPCTVGNGWLRVIDLGRYALALYDKQEGRGIRVFVDPERLKAWSEINAWFFKLKPKAEQDMDLLLEQIRQAGGDICGTQKVKAAAWLTERNHRGGFAICPTCGESYPKRDGTTCKGCQGDSFYLDVETLED